MGNPKTAQNRYLARMTTRDTPHVYVRVRWGGSGWSGYAICGQKWEANRLLHWLGGAMECELME